MATKKSTTLKAKTTRRAAKPKQSAPDVWAQLDDLHTRLYTLHRGIYYIGDHATDEACSAFFMLGKAVEHEYEAVGAMLHRRPMPGRAAS